MSTYPTLFYTFQFARRSQIRCCFSFRYVVEICVSRVIFEPRTSTDRTFNNNVFNDRGKINTYQRGLFQKTLAPQASTFIAWIKRKKFPLQTIKVSVRLRFSSENISANFSRTGGSSFSEKRKTLKSWINETDLIYLSYEQIFLFRVRAVFSARGFPLVFRVYRDCQTVSIPSPCGAPARSIKQIGRNNCETYNLIHCAEWHSAELAFPFSRIRGNAVVRTKLCLSIHFFPGIAVIGSK